MTAFDWAKVHRTQLARQARRQEASDYRLLFEGGYLGHRMKRNRERIEPNIHFWSAWKHDKAKMRQLGFRVYKNCDKWIVTLPR